MEPGLFAPCASCHVLAAQVEKATAEAADLQMQTEAACATASRGARDASLQASESEVARLVEENAAMEKRCSAARQDFKDLQAVHANTWARWQDEVSAWRTLHTDAQLVVDTTQGKIDRLEEQTGDLERTLGELMPSVAAARNEVERLHSIQSSLEAQNLQDTDWAKTEIKRLERASSQAAAEATAVRAERACAEEQLAEQSAEAGRQLFRFGEYQDRCATLEQEASAARAVIEKIRQECIEERKCCSAAVDLLHKTNSASRTDRACSPMPESKLVDLTHALGICMERSRALEAENEAICIQRQQEAEHCRHTVEHLRAKIRRHRTRCDALRCVSPE
jgi:chromosome segregation ATPase